MYAETELEDEDFLELEDEGEDFLFEHEHEHEGEGEFEDFLFEHEHEFENQFENENENENEFEDEDFLGALGNIVSSVLGGELESPLHEMQELELAHELLEVQSEQELEDFLGKVFKSAVKGVSNFAKSSAGKALGGALKGLAKKALPVVGGALGSFVAPGVGTAIGSKLGSMASNLFEMEGEIGEQELELEMARRVVRIGATAARNASRTAGSAPPKVVASRALVTATRRHAPNALRRTPQLSGVSYQRFRNRRPAASFGSAPRRTSGGRRGYAIGGRSGAQPTRRRNRPVYGYGSSSGAGAGSSRGSGYGYGARRGVRPAYGGSTIVSPGYGYGYWDGDYGSSYDGDSTSTRPRRSGRWYRKGNRIVLVGA